jgi:hypothetical protein
MREIRPRATEDAARQRTNRKWHNASKYLFFDIGHWILADWMVSQLDEKLPAWALIRAVNRFLRSCRACRS